MHSIFGSLFFVLLFALIGGGIARALKLPVLIGYIIAGIVGNILLQIPVENIHGLAEIGLILLLFSVGLELSLPKLARVGAVAVLGSLIQMIIVGLLSYGMGLMIGFPSTVAIVFAVCFALSSTAVVVKMLEEKGEIDTLHGEITIGWLLTQDLAVIPILALLPILGIAQGGNIFGEALRSVFISGVIVGLVFFLGRLFAPYVIRKISEANSRELLVVGGMAIALGTGYVMSVFGVSAALGAFLAGVVISETQQKHTIFSETRSLRDIFIVLFFATLGFLIDPAVLVNNVGFLVLLTLFVVILKFIVVLVVMILFDYRGKSSVATALGLAQIGEFSFVIFLTAQEQGFLTTEFTSIGIATAIISLVLTPFLFKAVVPVWQFLRNRHAFFKPAHQVEKNIASAEFKNHIVICGFGRMGKWVAKALAAAGIPFVVIEYNQKTVQKAEQKRVPIIYGDTIELEVLKIADIEAAKAVVIAIPDLIVQQEIIAAVQTLNPTILLFARGHSDSDVTKLSRLKITRARVIQPEFEAAASVIRQLFQDIGKSREYTSKHLTALRRSHTIAK